MLFRCGRSFFTWFDFVLYCAVIWGRYRHHGLHHNSLQLSQKVLQVDVCSPCGSSVLPVCHDSWLPEVFACMIWWQWCPDCASNWPELTLWPEKGVVTRRNSVQRSQRDFCTFASSFTPPLYAGGKAASSWLYPWLSEGSDAKRSSTVTSHADLTRLTNLRLQAVHGPELCTWGMVKTSKPLSSRWQRIQARSPKKSGIKMALKS